MPAVLSTLSALVDGQNSDLRSVVPLRPFIIGPQAALHRYNVTAEKPTALLGAYDPNADTTFLWPDRDPNSIIDLDYSKLLVTFDNPRLLYYSEPTGFGATVTPDPDFGNRIVADTLVFKTFTNIDNTTYTQSAVFGDRGVKVGDWLRISAIVSAVSYELWTTVTNLIHDVVPSVVSAATSDAANKTTQSATATFNQVIGTPLNHVTGTADASVYDGTVKGDISETYTVTVIQAGAGGVAVLQFQSASGLDDGTVTTAAMASPTDIGTNGGTVTFTDDSGRPVDAGVDPDDFVLGQKWTVVFNGAFTAPTVTSGGTYVGTSNATYIVTVTRGGLFPVTLVADPVTTPTVNPVGGGASGGLLQAGAYFLKYTFVNGAGETTPSPESLTFTVSAGNKPEVTLPALPTGVTSINIYLTAAGGGTGTETLYLTGVTTLTADLLLAQSVGAVPPVTNTCTVNSGDPPPQITVTTDIGVDSSGPTNVNQGNTAYGVGTLGATLKFATGTEICKGDIYYVPVLAPVDGAYHTLELGNDLGPNLSLATDLAVEFYLSPTSLVIPRLSAVPPHDPDWTVSQTYIILKAGIQSYISDWTVSGTQQPLPVKVADNCYVTFREWVFSNAGVIGETAGDGTVPLSLGTVDPDNPVAVAVSGAVANTAAALGITSKNATNDQVNVVRYAVLGGDPTVESNWQTVLDMVSGSGADGIYTVVPLTTDTNIHKLVHANVLDQSSTVNGNYRRMILPVTIDTTTVVVNDADTSDGNVALATINQDPTTLDTSFTYLQVSAGNAKFVSNGVKAGDKVRYNFSVDIYGNQTYTTYVVRSVLSEDALLLVTGSVSAITTPQKVEVWRDLTKDALVDQLIAISTSYADSRVNIVWPDVVGFGGVTYPGFYLATCLAGLSGAVPAHQGLTKIELQGVDTDLRANYFTSSQYDKLAAGGVWVVLQQTQGGRLYSHHAVTTDPTTVNSLEEMAVRDTDAVSYAYLGRWSRLYGSANVTDSALKMMSSDFTAVTNILISGTKIDRLGSMILNASLTSLVPSPTAADRVQASITVTLPVPLNHAELTLIV